MRRLKPLNIGLSSAWKKATSLETWRSVVDTATLKKKKKKKKNAIDNVYCNYYLIIPVNLNNSCYNDKIP